MTSLGSLGKQRAAVDLDFDWFGETIRVHSMASDLIEIEFLEKAQNINMDGVDLNAGLTPEAMTVMNTAAHAATNAMIGSIKRIIHPDDWDRFWAAAIANGQHLQDLMEVQKTITEAIVEAQAGFPTGPPSASPGGQPKQATGPSSTAGSLSPGPLTDADKALAMWRGRPDLQEFVVDKEDAERKALSPPG